MTHKENIAILFSARFKFIIKLITSIILVFLLLIIPIFYSYGIDYINNNNFDKAYYTFILLGIITVIYRLFEVLNQKSFYLLSSFLYKKYMEKGLEKTCNNSLYSLSRFSLSEYSNILSEDFELLSDYYATLIIRIVEILQFIYIIIYFFFINTVIGFITLIISIIAIFILLYFNKFVSKTNEERKHRNDERISLFQEIFLSIKEIKGYNLFRRIKGDISIKVDTYIKWNNKLNIDRYNLRQVVLLIVDMFKVVCLLYAVHLIINGHITIGVLTIIYSYYTKLSDLFASIILLNESITNVNVARKRIFKLFQYADNSDVMVNSSNDVIGEIVFTDVLYGNINKPILNNVSFTFKANSLNVLTGNIRASHGVFELLLLYNRKHKGSIYIDDKMIEEYDSESISNITSFVLNPTTFFNKSIKDNLLIFDNNFSSIVSVCKYLEIDSLIISLPEGYSTILYNNAQNIDENLKYMLAFTRVFLKKGRIILIDNLLDHLSAYYQKKVLNILINMRMEHTIIMITKNYKLIKNSMVDEIIVFKNSQLLCSGKHSDLLKSSSEYQDIINNL